MKAKPLYVFLLLLLATAGKAKAQGYQSYFGADSTTLNVYIRLTDFDQTVFFTINSTDTISINNYTYLQGILTGDNAGVFSGVFGESDFYFREDRDLGRLYRYIPSIDEELLLSDMSLMVGDTFSFPTQWGISQSVVNHITYENGRKVICFANDIYYAGYYMNFYEGVFPCTFPIGYYNNYRFSTMYLLCADKDGEQVFDHPYFESCYLHYSSVNKNQEVLTKTYPTSAYFTEIIHVEISEPILNVVVYDLFGREVHVNRIEETPCHWNLKVQSGVSGVYIIKITTKKGISFEKVFIHN
ncbi:MAG: T9SS type A sorting domain-containing protein [Bacteroidales bacterium]|nr:T9SS type A sorting domain-containing protein [Bacteroidales bacterium]